jgi:hypothetical protein
MSGNADVRRNARAATTAQLHRLVHDLIDTEHLAVLGHAHDHRPAPVQVDTDILSLLFHLGLLPLLRGGCGDLECARRTRFPTAGGDQAVLGNSHRFAPHVNGAGPDRRQAVTQKR